MKTIPFMLAAALGLALAGCKSSPVSAEASARKATQELRDTVAKSVPDPARQGEMLALVDQLEATQQGYNREVQVFVASFRRLNANYDTPRATLEELFQAFETQHATARDQVLAVHFKLAALATAAEWKQIAKAEEKLVEDLLKPRGHQDEEDAS